MKQVRIVWDVNGRRRTQTFNVLDNASEENLKNVVSKISALTTRNLDSAFVVDITPMDV